MAKLVRFRDESNIVAYMFVIAKEEDIHKPLTYYEDISSTYKSKWICVMKKETIL